MKKLLAVVAAVAVVMAIGAGTALATKPNPGHKITICHATPPDTAANGYDLSTVDVAAAGYQHSGHAAQHDADVIPAWEYSDAHGNAFSYLGKNWDEAGQAIWRNGCAVPGETPPPPSVNPTASIAMGTCDNQDSTAFLDNSDSNADVTFTVNGTDHNVVGAGGTQTVHLGTFEGTITVTVGEQALASDTVSYADCETPPPPSVNATASIAMGTCDNQDSTAFLDNSDSNADVTFTVNGTDHNVVGAGGTQTVHLGTFEGTITVTVGEQALASDTVSYADCETSTPTDTPSVIKSDPAPKAPVATAKSGDPKLAG